MTTGTLSIWPPLQHHRKLFSVDGSGKSPTSRSAKNRTSGSSDCWAPNRALMHLTRLPRARPDCRDRHSSNISCWSSQNTQAPVFFKTIAFAPVSPVIDGPCSWSDNNFVRVMWMPTNGLRSFFSTSRQVLRVFSWVVAFEEKLQIVRSYPQRCISCKCRTVTSLTVWLNSMVWW